MTKSLGLLLLSLLVAATATAQTSKKKISTKAPEMSVRDEAIMENQSIDQRAYKKTIKASEVENADVSSFLKLKDPALDLKQRAWSWDMDFKLQTLKPIGSAQVNGLSVNMGEYGQGVMPSVDVGIVYTFNPSSRYQWTSGAAVNAGYMTQKTTLISPTGYQFSDTRLNTTILGGIWKNQFRDTEHPNWAYLVNPEAGVIGYTQSSTQSSFANFSQHSNFFGLGLGVDYSLSSKWGVLAEYDYRNAGNSQESQIQQDNFEIGTRVTW